MELQKIKSPPLTSKDKLDALRAELKKRNLDGFVIPRMSEFQGEFVAPYAERLAWLTGFTGSAGAAIVLTNNAAILTDGRYTLQLAQQADGRLYFFENVPRTGIAKWLNENAKAGQVIGYDPWLHPAHQVRDWESTLSGKNIKMIPVEDNPLDSLWETKPAFPRENAEVFPDKIAGSSSNEKRRNIASVLKEKKIQAMIITMPDSLAWLLNIRGADVAHTPVVLSFGIVHDDARVQWFVHPDKIPADVKNHIGSNVEIIDPSRLEMELRALESQTVGLDFTRSPAWFWQKLPNVKDTQDPCVQPKAIKTREEQDAIRAAHERDGAAMVNFLYWLEEHGKSGKITELDIDAKLQELRGRDNSYRGPSFDTIAGWGSNGAIVHYRATKETSKTIKSPGLLLIDSGGQYNDGTTDITRTVAIGEPTAEMKTRFTLVLKGHIALARARFPEGTNGAQLDTLARQPLWAEGLDYAHGTGHGVGCFLSVHEESAGISSRGREPLKPGMLLSNEPGYYREGAYGIRIENLVLVMKENKTSESGAALLHFETVSLAPIDRNLIRKELLSVEEIAWLNDYHARVVKIISPRLEPKVKAWLEQQARPL